VAGSSNRGGSKLDGGNHRMKKYMADWDANVTRSKDAASMRANVLKQYPKLGMEFTLNDRVATYFPADTTHAAGATDAAMIACGHPE
jgi:hypothetical protein